MFRLQVISDKTFLLFFNEPGRVEVWTSPGGSLHADVYTGMEIVEDQDPIGCFDGSVPRPEISSWEHTGKGMDRYYIRMRLMSYPDRDSLISDLIDNMSPSDLVQFMKTLESKGSVHWDDARIDAEEK